MPQLSGGQVTRLWPYGGPGGQYGDFAVKTAGGTKTYTATFTQHSVYGGVGTPYGAFSGKSPGTPFSFDAVTIALSGTVTTDAEDFDVDVNWDFEQPLAITPLAGTLGVAASFTWNSVGTLARTNANDTLAGTGTTTIVGTLARTLANDTLSASGTVDAGIVGTVNVTNGSDTSSGQGSPGIVGTLNVTTQNDTLAGGGGGTVVGTVAVTNRNDTSNISGLVGDPPTGTASKLPLMGVGA